MGTGWNDRHFDNELINQPYGNFDDDEEIYTYTNKFGWWPKAFLDALASLKTMLDIKWLIK